MEPEKQSKFKSIMIQIYLKIKCLFELLFKIEIKKCIAIAVVCASVLASCTPQKRIERIAEKYNLYCYDTINVPGDTVNMIFPVAVLQHDTVIVRQQGEAVTVVQVKHDTIIINTTTPKKTITTQKIDTSKKHRNTGLICFVVFLCLCVTAFIVLDVFSYEKHFKLK